MFHVEHSAHEITNGGGLMFHVEHVCGKMVPYFV
jgi:hypothetical protein